MPSILFVCTANRFRSPIAAIYFARAVVKHRDDGEITVSSAGTWTVSDRPAMPEAINQAKKYGLNLKLHKSRPITREILSRADLIIVMENNHKEAIMQEFPFVANHLYLLAEVVDGLPNDIPDPYASEEPPEVITREIITMIDRGYNQIVDLAWEKYRGNSSR
jgi:protein-tyrosine-phosphatase